MSECSLNIKRVALARRKILRLAISMILLGEQMLKEIQIEGMGFEEQTVLDAPLSDEDNAETLHDLLEDHRSNESEIAINNVILEQCREILGSDWQRKMRVIAIYSTLSESIKDWTRIIKRQTDFSEKFIRQIISGDLPKLRRELKIPEFEHHPTTRR